ncbi:LLM class flavin-dependent oxidoreductase [Rhabdothermincola sediminis]|uniref:LLM class flavin-dependent oxidoreductase n=1 Tax=Rhabdothermincola sediminis TaxID=2751370 RepID=UPI001AA08A01|nr:LLM class flavin-dependent oxidoreductase [Rhabdothermincola sediminis]
MRFGLDLAQQRMPFTELIARARFADDAGFDGIWGFDHYQPMYGSGPGECFEGNTTLAALSGHTSGVRLGLLVTGVTYRHPSVLAAEAMTIDHASGGRLELSLGAAWFEPEHRALGIPFPPTAERIEMLDEALTIIKGLLGGDDFSFEGRHWTIERARLHPLPVQRPHPPIWVGASGERKMLPLVARHADVWHTFGDPPTIARKAALLDRFAEEQGRDPATIARAASLSLSEPWPEVRANAEALAATGVGYLVCGWPSEGRSRVEEFVEQVMPDLRGA